MTHWHICNKYSCDDVSDIPLLISVHIAIRFFSSKSRVFGVGIGEHIEVSVRFCFSISEAADGTCSV